jgi:protein-tyrosine phosphatase
VTVKDAKKGETVVNETVAGTSLEIDNLEVAAEYSWTVAGGGSSARGTFKTMDLAPRVMSVKGVPNFRDMGGWRTTDGRRVRQGLVYRSQGLNNNARYYLNSKETMALYKAGKLEEQYGKLGAEIRKRIDDEGGKIDFDPNAPWMRKSLPRRPPLPPLPRLDGPTKAYLLDKLGLKTDIDLRGPNEVWGMTESPLGPRAKWIWAWSHAYGGMGNPDGKEGFTKVFKVFLDEQNYPIDIHCIGGADRTGCHVWVLNGLLGVAEDDLMKDWEITCFEYESQSFGHEGRIDRFLKLLDDESGATMREKCESFVKSLGFAQSDIDNFRSIMLERPKK